MLVHNVYFWLKDGIGDAEREAFRDALGVLLEIDPVTGGYIGTPAAVPERPVCETSYDFALTVLLPDVEAHNRYQEAPEHLAFIEANQALWQRVLVLDAD